MVGNQKLRSHSPELCSGEWVRACASAEEDDNASIYTIFGPRDKLEQERQEILRNWPPEDYATRITPLANGEILMVSHLDFKEDED